jgi:hypothetical protein
MGSVAVSVLLRQFFVFNFCFDAKELHNKKVATSHYCLPLSNSLSRIIVVLYSIHYTFLFYLYVMMIFKFQIILYINTLYVNISLNNIVYTYIF